MCAILGRGMQKLVHHVGRNATSAMANVVTCLVYHKIRNGTGYKKAVWTRHEGTMSESVTACNNHG